MRITKAEREAEKAKRMARLVENHAHVKRGTCPDCGCGLRRNLSMTGWFQCNALGAVGFQTGDGIGKPACNFQFFFDPTPAERDIIDSPVASRPICGSCGQPMNAHLPTCDNDGPEVK